MEFAATLARRRREAAANEPSEDSASLKEKAERLIASLEQSPAPGAPVSPLGALVAQAEENVAVVSLFDPETVAARLHVPDELHAAFLSRLAPLCTMHLEGNQTLWRLGGERRNNALRRLMETQRLAGVLDNSLPVLDVSCRMLQSILRGEAIDLGSLNLNELLGVSWALEALPGLAIAKPDAADVHQHLAKRQFMADYDVLLEKGFFGREEQLESLGKFLSQVGPQRQILLMRGLGGSGKSTLIAKFSRDVVASLQATVVVLDFDRPGIDPRDQRGLEMEMARQVGAQIPEADQTLREAREAVRRQSAELYELESAHASEAVEHLRGDRADLLYPIGEILRPTGRPLLLILDTFEEVVRRDLIWRILDWIDEVSSALYKIYVRVVISGRLFGKADADLQGQANEQVEVGEFQPPMALTFLTGLGVPVAVASQMVESQLMPLRPLELKLLAKMISSGQAGTLDELLADLEQGGPAAKELFAGLVYRRVLLRVSVPEESREEAEGITDEILRSLAYPGLVLRYVTPDLIRTVLVPGLGMPELSEIQAEKALDLLALHEWLAFRQGGKVWHRRDLRRSILRPMIAENPNRARVIHRLAIAECEKADDPESRNEAFYHRLMLMTGEPQDPPFDLEILRKAAPSFQMDESDLPRAGAVLLSYAVNGDVALEDVRLLPPTLRKEAYQSKGASLVESREFGSALRLYIHSRTPTSNWERTLLLATGEWDKLAERQAEPATSSWLDVGASVLSSAVSSAVTGSWGGLTLDLALSAVSNILGSLPRWSGAIRSGIATSFQEMIVGLSLIAKASPPKYDSVALKGALLSTELVENRDPVLEKTAIFLRLYANEGLPKDLPISPSTILLDPAWLGEAIGFLGKLGRVPVDVQKYLNEVLELVTRPTGSARTVRGLLHAVQAKSAVLRMKVERPDPDSLLRYLEFPRAEFRDPARFALLGAFPDDADRPELAQLFAASIPLPLDDLQTEAFLKDTATSVEHALVGYIELADRCGSLEKLLSLALERRAQNRKLQMVLNAVQRWREAAHEIVHQRLGGA